MNEKVTQPHRSRPKRITFYALILAAAVIIGCVAWQMYLHINPQARVDFTVYEPKKLPGKLTVQNTSIDIWSNRLWFASGVGVDWPFPYSVGVTKSLGQSGSSISQEKNKDSAYSCPTNLVLSTCQIQFTSAGQQYKLTVDTYSPPDTTAEEYASFTKGGTHITIRIVTDTAHLVSSADWSNCIDSFVPTTLTGVSAHYYHPGP